MKWEFVRLGRGQSYWRGVSEKLGPVKITRARGKYYLMTNPWTGEGQVLGVHDNLTYAKWDAAGILKNPRKRRTKFDRCVAEVTRRGGAYNPAAVCEPTLRRRRKNPRGVGARHWFRLIARRGSTRLVYIGANKFSRHGQPVYFPTMKAAETMARWLNRQFPDAFRGFSFHAVEN